MATFVVKSEFTRTLPDGSALHQPVSLVQRPPGDRLLMGLGSTAGRLDGKIVRCASTPSGTSQCFTSVDAGDYTAEVDREIAGLETCWFEDPYGNVFILMAKSASQLPYFRQWAATAPLKRKETR